jgi:hypothetical protein
VGTRAMNNFKPNLTWNDGLVLKVPGKLGLWLSIHNALKKDPANNFALYKIVQFQYINYGRFYTIVGGTVLYFIMTWSILCGF